MCHNKKITPLMAAMSVFFLKVAIEKGVNSMPQLFEILTLLNLSFLIIGLINVNRKSFVFEFVSSSKGIIRMAEKNALYTILDFLCLAVLSLQTYCAIKFCITATFKVNERGMLTNEDVPRGAMRIAVMLMIVPATILIDLVIFKPKGLIGHPDNQIIWQLVFIMVHILNTIVVYQIALGSSIKKLKENQKANDLTKMRLVSSMIVCTLSQPLIYLCNSDPNPHNLVDFTNQVCTYICLTICLLINTVAYIFIGTLRSKKDSLVPPKEFSFYLLWTVTPLLIINYLFILK